MSDRHTIVCELLWDEETRQHVAAHMERICDECVSFAWGNVLAGYARGWEINGNTNPIPLDWLFEDLAPLLKSPIRFAILSADGKAAARTAEVGPDGVRELFPEAAATA